MDTQWDGEEKRSQPPHNLAETIEIIDRLLETKFEARFQRLEQVIRRGFPGEDVEGHRHYHEAVIRRMEERAEFWRELSLELAKWGLLGFLGWLLVAAWQQLLHGPK